MRLVQFVLASDAPAGNKGVVRVGVELPVAAGNGSDVDAGAGAGAGAGANGGGVESRSAGKVLDLTAAFRMEGAADGVPDLLSAGMKGLLAGGAAAMAAVRKAMVAARRSSACVLDRSDIVLKAPIYDSEKVLCVGMNYVDHCTEQGFPIPKVPIIFNKFASCIVGDGDNIVMPDSTSKLDFEVELVIVVGKTAKRVPRERAMEYVAGYTVAHDVSARDWQLERNGGQWLLGKSFDTFGPLGPAIVTPDELGDAHKLGIRCLLNGKRVQDSNTDQLIFKTAYLIEFISRSMTLQPGDLILTGTPPGVGCFRTPPLWLKPGDVVTCEIDGIGAITNTIVAEEPTASP